MDAGDKSGLKVAGGLVLWLGVVAGAAALGSWGSRDAPTFYAQLSKPPWAPPPWLFGPVWSVLYLLMALAAWLVWRTPASAQRSAALGLFVAQLAANALWSWLFFRWRSGALALADILALLVLLSLVLRSFWRLKPLAGVLLVPYLAWVCFATVLTWTVWRANPTLLAGR